MKETRKREIHFHLIHTRYKRREHWQKPDGYQQNSDGVPHDVGNKQRVETVLQLLLVDLEVKRLSKEEQVTGNHKEQRNTHGNQRHTRIIDQELQKVRHVLTIHDTMDAKAPVIIYKIEMSHYHHHRQWKPQATNGLRHQLIVRHNCNSLISAAKLQRKYEFKNCYSVNMSLFFGPYGLMSEKNSNFAAMKKGLVLEGGAMRGLFTCGIIDVMMEAGVEPDGLIGVSAGAAFGCNYKSRQPGRAIRYNKRFARDKRFCSWQSWLKTGDLYNAEFGYHTMPTQLDIFDDKAFDENPMQFVVVCTDVMTGKPVYKELMKCEPVTYDWIRASASMPVASKVVELEGRKVLDGGVADSIPLEYFERIGYDRNIVILTQPDGYVKEHNRLMPLMRIGLRKYPQMIEAMDKRHLMYNQQLEFVRQAEREGRCLVIRPDEKLPIGHISHDPEQTPLTPNP